MKKLIVSICTVFCLMAAPLTAVEWGGLFFNDTGASMDVSEPENLEISQANGLSLWLKSPLADSGFYFSGEALYKFKLSFKKGDSPVFEQIADVPLLKVAGDVELGSGLLSLNAGRFYYVDSTATVLSQTIDGASVKYSLPAVNLGLFLGYTGLLNSLNVPMAGCSPKPEAKIYDLAEPYLPLGVTFEFPSLFANQSLELDAYYIADLTVSENSRCYADLLLSGPITNSVFYNVTTSFGFVNFKDLMNYSSFALLFFPTKAVTVTAGANFGSADDQGPFTAYSSLAATSMLAAGKITPKAAFTYTTDSLYFNVGGNLPFEYIDSKYGISVTQWDFSLMYNIFTDFQVGFTVNTTFDLTGSNSHNFKAKLSAALAF